MVVARLGSSVMKTSDPGDGGEVSWEMTMVRGKDSLVRYRVKVCVSVGAGYRPSKVKKRKLGMFSSSSNIEGPRTYK